MPNVYTATYILTSLKRRGMLPDTDEALSSDDYLEILTEELRTYIVPLLLSVREEYLVADEDHVVVDENSFEIPYRAIGGKLRDVLLSDGNGGFYQVPRIEPERVDNGDEGYYVKANRVVLDPAPAAGQTVRLSYFRRPSRVVSEFAAPAITAINTSTNTVTFASPPPATLAVNTKADLVKAKPGFDVLAADSTITAASGNTLTFASLPEGLAVGDFVGVAEESPIPQIPVELHPLLAHRVVVRVLEALGDKKASVAEQTCERMRKAALTLLTPRIEGSPRTIINRNAPGWGRSGSTRWRR